MRRLTLDEVRARRVPAANGCLEWNGSIHKSGYGIVSFGGRTHKAHRFFYEVENGPIPAGAYICHRCHNKRFCNPAHLYAGSQADNMRDMVAAGRQAAGDKIARHKMGAMNAAAKLTAEQSAEIRRLRRGGQSLRALAAAFGISQASVSRIARGQQWRENT